jgi:hypothetical protein
MRSIAERAEERLQAGRLRLKPTVVVHRDEKE